MPQNGATSQPQNTTNIQPDLDSKPYQGNSSNQQQDSQDPFSSHQTANDAANGLFMLAQAGGQRNQQQQQQQQQYQMQQQQGYQQQQSNQQDMNKRATKGSIVSTMSGSTEGEGQYSDEDTKPQSKSKGKKGSGGKSNQNGGKRKTEETPSKAQPIKKQKGSNGAVIPMEDDDDDDEPMMDDQDEHGPDGKKMTDEEKRKNFLERNRYKIPLTTKPTLHDTNCLNRVAALKCRQRKKQWLANLQQKVEIFSSENDALAATVTQLREEIVGLKTLLLAHKDCPVSQAQGISGMAMQQIAGDGPHYANPYGMAAMGPQQGQGQQGMLRR